MMISCDMCNVWQHGACVGIWGDEEAPDGQCMIFRYGALSELIETCGTCGFKQNISVKSVGRVCMHL